MRGAMDRIDCQLSDHNGLQGDATRALSAKSGRSTYGRSASLLFLLLSEAENVRQRAKPYSHVLPGIVKRISYT